MTTNSPADYRSLFGLANNVPKTVCQYAKATTNPEHLNLLADHESGFVVIAVINNPATPESTLMRLWSRRVKQSKIASLARVIDSPLYEHITTDADDGYLLAKNPYLTPELVTELLEQPANSNHRRKVIELLASNPATPSELLSELYEANPLVRERFAGNPATPSELLVELAKGGSHSLCKSLVRNPATPSEALGFLMGWAGLPEHDRERILSHPNYKSEA